MFNRTLLDSTLRAYPQGSDAPLDVVELSEPHYPTPCGGLFEEQSFTAESAVVDLALYFEEVFSRGAILGGVAVVISRRMCP